MQEMHAELPTCHFYSFDYVCGFVINIGLGFVFVRKEEVGKCVVQEFVRG